MRRREFVGMDGVPAHLRYIPVSEWEGSPDDITDEEVEEAFSRRPPADIVYDGKESTHHIVDVGGKQSETT